MNKEQLGKDIYVIHNFLSDIELNQYMDVIKDNPDGWMSAQATTNKAFENNLLRISDSMFLNLKEKIKLLDIPGSCINLHGFFQRFQEGQSMNMHSDEPHNGIVSGIIIYFNDEFTGGEIVYPEGITEYSPKETVSYKPKAGDLVYHDAKIHHLVNTINSGTRYAITAFKNSCKLVNCDEISCFHLGGY
jgi:predicted 2-oxoglutarate/Fe(II)-dependent dioxygenase YbiX